MNSLEMLKTEEGQLNAVFACFGSAAQHCQFFEVALGDFLLAYNRLCKTKLTLADFDALETKVRKKTMGQLLVQLKNHATIDDEKFKGLMDEAVEERNFLMHYFFRQRDEKFRTEKGRMDMIAELIAIGSRLEKATDITNGMRVALQAALSGTGNGLSSSDVVFTMEVNIPDGSDAV